MVLSDFGADVVRVDRSAGGFNADILARYAIRPSAPLMIIANSGGRQR
jgi:crotonobetainyl-CoA:carnitine CoA-transferase CaiB-like acyl-CoA transferase